MNNGNQRQARALIVGAGPAGLTAAFELLERTDIEPVILEKTEYIGGISRTVCYKNNRMDIGGHRFFSKSDRVMQWWTRVMPVEAAGNDGIRNLGYHGQSREFAAQGPGPDPARDHRVMLVRNRKSRIYFLRQFFEYPIQFSAKTLRQLGVARTVKVGLSYFKSLVHRIAPENTLEQFLINRFGRELYQTFFKSYTEKVWGVPCAQISAEWGAQRIKGLSISKAIRHVMKKRFAAKRDGDLAQKQTETSLIEKFLYPKLGPGQLWEYVAEDVQKRGGIVKTGWQVDKLLTRGRQIVAVEAFHPETGERETIEADYFFSTMPVKELVRCLDAPVPPDVRQVSDGLVYRDFITVGMLLKKLAIHDQIPQGAKLLSDNWIYIQEPDVQVGRMQIFNNWSPYLVADPANVWIGLEYFCYETDDIWKLSDADMVEFAKSEMVKIGIIDPADVLDACVVRVPKTYPAYFGSYERFSEVRTYLDGFQNLFLVGRNGMHKYNNQDHSMLTAMTAVDNIVEGRLDKSNIWQVNTEMEYHETKAEEPASQRLQTGIPAKVSTPV